MVTTLLQGEEAQGAPEPERVVSFLSEYGFKRAEGFSRRLKSRMGNGKDHLLPPPLTQATPEPTSEEEGYASPWSKQVETVFAKRRREQREWIRSAKGRMTPQLDAKSARSMSDDPVSDGEKLEHARPMTAQGFCAGRSQERPASPTEERRLERSRRAREIDGIRRSRKELTARGDEHEEKRLRSRRRRAHSSGALYEMSGLALTDSEAEKIKEIAKGPISRAKEEYLEERLLRLRKEEAGHARTAATISTVLQIVSRHHKIDWDGPFNIFPKLNAVERRRLALAEEEGGALQSVRSRRRNRGGPEGRHSFGGRANAQMVDEMSGAKDPAAMLLLRTSTKALEESRDAFLALGNCGDEVDDVLATASAEEKKAFAKQKEGATLTEIIGAARSADASLHRLDYILDHCEDEEERAENAAVLLGNRVQRLSERTEEEASIAKMRVVLIKDSLDRARNQLQQRSKSAREKQRKIRKHIAPLLEESDKRDLLLSPDFEEKLGVHFDAVPASSSESLLSAKGAEEIGTALAGIESAIVEQLQAEGKPAAETPIIQEGSQAPAVEEEEEEEDEREPADAEHPQCTELASQGMEHNEGDGEEYEGGRKGGAEQGAMDENEEENENPEVFEVEEEGKENETESDNLVELHGEAGHWIRRWNNMRARDLAMELEQLWGMSEQSGELSARQAHRTALEELDTTLVADAMVAMDTDVGARLVMALSPDKMSNVMDFLTHHFSCELLTRGAIGSAALPVKRVEEMYKSCELGKEEVAGYMACVQKDEAGWLLSTFSSTEGSHLLAHLAQTNGDLAASVCSACPYPKSVGSMLADLVSSSVAKGAQAAMAIGPKLSSRSIPFLLTRQPALAGSFLDVLSVDMCASMLRWLCILEGEIAASWPLSVTTPFHAASILCALAGGDQHIQLTPSAFSGDHSPHTETLPTAGELSPDHSPELEMQDRHHRSHLGQVEQQGEVQRDVGGKTLQDEHHQWQDQSGDEELEEDWQWRTVRVSGAIVDSMATRPRAATTISLLDGESEGVKGITTSEALENATALSRASIALQLEFEYERQRTLQYLERLKPHVAGTTIIELRKESRELASDLLSKVSAEWLSLALLEAAKVDMGQTVTLAANMWSVENLAFAVAKLPQHAGGTTTATGILSGIDKDTLSGTLKELLSQLDQLTLARLLEGIDKAAIAEAMGVLAEFAGEYEAKRLLEVASGMTAAMCILQVAKAVGHAAARWLVRRVSGKTKAQVLEKLVEMGGSEGIQILGVLGSSEVAEVLAYFDDHVHLATFLQSLSRVDPKFCSAMLARVGEDQLASIYANLPLDVLTSVLKVAPEEASAEALAAMPTDWIQSIEEEASEELLSLLQQARAAGVTAAVLKSDFAKAASLLESMGETDKGVMALQKLATRQAECLPGVVDNLASHNLICKLILHLAISEPDSAWQALSTLRADAMATVACFLHDREDAHELLRSILRYEKRDGSAGQVLSAIASNRGGGVACADLIGVSPNILLSLLSANPRAAGEAILAMAPATAAENLQSLETDKCAELIMKTLQLDRKGVEVGIAAVIRFIRPTLRGPALNKLVEEDADCAMGIIRADEESDGRTRLMEGMGPSARARLLGRLCDYNEAEGAAMLALLETKEAAEVVKQLSLDRASHLLTRLDPADLAALVAVLPPKRGEDLLQLLDPAVRSQAREATARALGRLANRSPADAAAAVKQGKLDLLPSVLAHAVECSPSAAASLLSHMSGGDVDTTLLTMATTDKRWAAASALGALPTSSAAGILSSMSTTSQRQCGLLLAAMDPADAKNLLHSMRGMRQVEAVRCALRFDPERASRLLFALRRSGLERVFSRLRTEERADIASNLTPEEAASIVRGLGPSEREDLLTAMEPDASVKARAALQHQMLQETAGALRKPYVKWLRGVSKIARLHEYRERMNNLLPIFPEASSWQCAFHSKLISLLALMQLGHPLQVIKELSTFSRPSRVVALIVAALLLLTDGESFAEHLEQPGNVVPWSDSRLIIFWRAAKRFLKQRTEGGLLQTRLAKLQREALNHEPNMELSRLGKVDDARELVHRQLTVENVRKALMPAKVLYLWLGALLGYIDILENKVWVFSLRSAKAEADGLKVTSRVFRSYR